MSLRATHPLVGSPAGVVRFHSPPGSDTDDGGVLVDGGVGEDTVPELGVGFVVALGVGAVGDGLSLPQAPASAATATTAITLPYFNCIRPP
jgi:hypothetical protein